MVAFFTPWFLRTSGTALLIFMTCRACPNLVPRKKDLKKHLDGPSRNFWYSVEEDKYLGASVLGSDVMTVKKLRRGDWHISQWFLETTYLAFVST